ncbi:MAG: DUF4304 domain-containing protein [Saprospiraceae bacterium]
MVNEKKIVREIIIFINQILLDDWVLSNRKLDNNKEYKEIVQQVFIKSHEMGNEEIVPKYLCNTKIKGVKTLNDTNKNLKIFKRIIKEIQNIRSKNYYKSQREKKQKIMEVIKKRILPYFRGKGFKGSFPNLRRLKNNQLNLLSFQFHRFGSSFTIEIGNCSYQGIKTKMYTLPPEKCKPSNTGKRSIRVGRLIHGNDYWYVYESGSENPDIYNSIAKEIIESWEAMENWWKENSKT